jgi:hypothetical protein
MLLANDLAELHVAKIGFERNKKAEVADNRIFLKYLFTVT